jgi:hypothetical protein
MLLEGKILLHVKMKREEKGARPLSTELVAELNQFPELSQTIINASGKWDVETMYTVLDAEELGILLQKIRNLPIVVQCVLSKELSIQDDAA